MSKPQQHSKPSHASEPPLKRKQASLVHTENKTKPNQITEPNHQTQLNFSKTRIIHIHKSTTIIVTYHQMDPSISITRQRMSNHQGCLSPIVYDYTPLKHILEPHENNQGPPSSNPRIKTSNGISICN